MSRACCAAAAPASAATGGRYPQPRQMDVQVTGTGAGVGGANKYRCRQIVMFSVRPHNARAYWCRNYQQRDRKCEA
jgi:hypothetical protein